MRNLLLSAGLVLLSNAASAGILNGDFELGNLSGWTTYTTSDGRLSPGNTGAVVALFDTDGDGVSSLAAKFRVGQLEPYDAGVMGGGGIFQTITTGAGTLSFSANVAAYLDPTSTLNYNPGGFFQVLLDGVSKASWDAGGVAIGATNRGTLSFTAAVSEGTHEIRLRMMREYLTGESVPERRTPFQFIDNVVVNAPVAAVPEPAALALWAVGLGVLALGREKASH